MDTSISDKLIPKNIKKKPKRKSPLSETYKKFLKQENIKLSPSKKQKPTKLEDIKINVIKSPEIHKEKKPCKRKRVRVNKNGVPNKEDILHNKKCEKICINNLCYKHYLKSTKTKKTIKELRLIAKDMKLKKYSRLRKQELIELIEKNKNI